MSFPSPFFSPPPPWHLPETAASHHPGAAHHPPWHHAAHHAGPRHHSRAEGPAAAGGSQHRRGRPLLGGDLGLDALLDAPECGLRLVQRVSRLARLCRELRAATLGLLGPRARLEGRPLQGLYPCRRPLPPSLLPDGGVVLRPGASPRAPRGPFASMWRGPPSAGRRRASPFAAPLPRQRPPPRRQSARRPRAPPGAPLWQRAGSCGGWRSTGRTRTGTPPGSTPRSACRGPPGGAAPAPRRT